MKQGLKDAASVSLETKAALIGVMYALERLFAASGKVGTDLVNFNALIGGSEKSLQQYQYAARKVGVSNEEVEATFKSLSATATKTLTGGSAPSGISRISTVLKAQVGEVQGLLYQATKGNVEPLFQKLQEYAQKEKNQGLRNENLKSFGLSDGIIAGMARNGFRPEILAQAPTYSDKQAAQLAKNQAAWSELGNHIEMAVGKFNARHGGELVQGLTQITDKVIKLTEAFTVLAEKTKFFEIIGKSIEGWTFLLGLLVDEVNSVTSEGEKKFDNPNGIGHVVERVSAAVGGIKKTNAFGGADVGGLFSAIGAAWRALPKGNNPRDPNHRVPGLFPQNYAVPTEPRAPQNTQGQTVNVKQDLHFNHDGKDAAKTGDSVKKSVKDFWNTSPARAGGY